MPVCMMICEGVPKLESESILRASPVFGHQSFVTLRPGNSFSSCRNFPLESMRMAMSASVFTGCFSAGVVAVVF